MSQIIEDRDVILEKFGETEMEFSSYYKYSFSFEGETKNGEQISASVGGGDSYDIYKRSIDRNKVKLDDLYPSSIEVTKDGKTIASWDGW